MQKVNRGKQKLSKMFELSENNTAKIQQNDKNYRNKCLMYRYYYYYELQQKRFDITIELLANEFFVSQDTIQKVLSNNTDLLKDVINEAPTVKDLKLKYQFLNW